MPNQPSTPAPNIIIEINREGFQHTLRIDPNRQLQSSTATEINLAYQRLRGPNTQVSFNINNDLRGLGTHHLTDAERARGDLHIQVRVAAPSSITIRHGPHVQASGPDRPPTPYWTAARRLGFLPTLHLDELAEDRRNCPVCTEPFSMADRPMLLHCNHLVGRRCIERWVESGHNSCPMCRAPVIRRAS